MCFEFRPCRSGSGLKALPDQFWSSTVPGNGQVVIRVEVRFLRLEFDPFTSIDNWLSETFCISRLPVRTKIVVGQVGDKEIASLDFHSQTVIDEASTW